MNGKGVYNFDNGDIYDGEWKKGKAEGKCRFYHSSQGKWVNEIWKDNQFWKEA